MVLPPPSPYPPSVTVVPASPCPCATRYPYYPIPVVGSQAQGALEHSNGDLAAAITLLLNGPAGGVSPPAAPAAPTAPAVDRPPSMDPFPPRRALSRGGNSGRFELPATLPPKVAKLVEMGFTKEQVDQQLRRSHTTLP